MKKKSKIIRGSQWINNKRLIYKFVDYEYNATALIQLFSKTE